MYVYYQWVKIDILCMHPFFCFATVNEPLGMWDGVRKYRCGRQWLALGFLWLGGPLTGQAGICRKEETGWLMHLVIPLIRLLQPFQRQGGKERDREPNTIFSQRGTRAQHSWHCHWAPNNPYSILCALGEWMATVCEPHRPSLPSEGESQRCRRTQSPGPGPASVPSC